MTIGRWWQAGMAMEHPAEVMAVGKTGGLGNGVDAAVRVHQGLSGPSDAALLDVALRGGAEMLTKDPGEVVGAHGAQAGQGADVQVLMRSGPDPTQSRGQGISEGQTVDQDLEPVLREAGDGQPQGGGSGGLGQQMGCRLLTQHQHLGQEGVHDRSLSQGAHRAEAGLRPVAIQDLGLEMHELMVDLTLTTALAITPRRDEMTVVRQQGHPRLRGVDPGPGMAIAIQAPMTTGQSIPP